MNLWEITVSDFSNQPITLDHLFKVQLARAHELAVYFHFIITKYPTTILAQTFDFSSGAPNGLVSALPEMAINELTKLYSGKMNLKAFELTGGIDDDDKKVIPKRIVDKYMQKLKALITAKKNYQRIGGKY